MFFNLVFSLFNCVQGAAYAPVEFVFTNQAETRLTIQIRSIQTTLQDRLCFEKTYGAEVPMSMYMGGGVRSQEEIDKRFKNYTEWTNHRGYPWICAMAFLKSVETTGGATQLTPGQFLGEIVIEPWNDDGDAELAYVLVPESWNQGICTALVGKLLESVVPCLRGNTHMYNIQRLWATARPDNIGSWRVLEKNGFVKEVREDGQAVVGIVHSSTVETTAAPSDRWKYYLPIAKT